MSQLLMGVMSWRPLSWDSCPTHPFGNHVFAEQDWNESDCRGINGGGHVKDDDKDVLCTSGFRSWIEEILQNLNVHAPSALGVWLIPKYLH